MTARPERVTEYEISPRVRVTAGDPVRVAGRRGLFRFLHIEHSPSLGQAAAVVGPKGGAEIERIVPVGDLRSAGRTARSTVAQSPEAADLNRRAHRR